MPKPKTKKKDGWKVYDLKDKTHKQRMKIIMDGLRDSGIDIPLTKSPKKRPTQ